MLTANYLLYQIINKDTFLYTIKISKLREELEILITEQSSLSSTYKVSLNIENFHKINKFFRQFDTVEEIFEYFNDLEDIGDNTTILTDNKFAKLNIKLPNISKSKANNNFLLQIPKIELKENDLIVKLCEQVKKIDILENKINIYYVCLEKMKKNLKYLINI